MASSSSRRVRQRRNNGLNFEFPDDILDRIFTYLPIKQCVQTGVVAKKYKQTWKKCRNLDFITGFTDYRRTNRSGLISAVNKVFTYLVAPEIDCFRLCLDPMGVEPLVESWVSQTIQKNARELELSIYQAIAPFCHPIPDVAKGTLREIKLQYSIMHMPFNLKTLEALTTVILRKVDLTAMVIEVIFDNCACLEAFDMAKCYGVRTLKVRAKENKRFRDLKVGACPEISVIEIEAPTLRLLYYSGKMVRTFEIVEPLLLLEHVVINFLPSLSFNNLWLVEELLGKISHARALTVTSAFLEGLSSKIRHGSIQETQFFFSNLRELTIVMEGSSFANVGDISCFLKNSPHLESLLIDFCENALSEQKPLYWKLVQNPAMDEDTSFLSSLRKVKIKGFKFVEQGIQFAKIILEKAVFLERMVLVWPRNKYGRPMGNNYLLPNHRDMYHKFFNSMKLSPGGEIVLLNHKEDKDKYIRKTTLTWF